MSMMSSERGNGNPEYQRSGKMSPTREHVPFRGRLALRKFFGDRHRLEGRALEKEKLAQKEKIHIWLGMKNIRHLLKKLPHQFLKNRHLILDTVNAPWLLGNLITILRETTHRLPITLRTAHQGNG